MLLTVQTGLRYKGRIDDLAVLASGLKVDALTLERTLNTHSSVSRSAVITSFDQQTLVVLIEPTSSGEHRVKARELLRCVLDLNQNLTAEKRIYAKNIFLVDSLPVTTKSTLNRKLVRKIWSENSGKWPAAIRLIDLTNELGVSKQICARVATLLAGIFNIPEDYFANASANLSDIPLTSLASVRLARALEEEFSVRVTEAQLYGLRNVGDIHALVDKLPEPTFPPSINNSLPVPSDDDALVITGLACRFPGHLRCLSDFATALLDPRSYANRVSKKVPISRWKAESLQDGVVPPIAWLEDDAFPAPGPLRGFFNLSPSDAESLSPNARLVLHLGYQAIEDAGISPRSLDGKAWGVFTSLNPSGWRE